jgi:hypothetical protein
VQLRKLPLGIGPDGEETLSLPIPVRWNSKMNGPVWSWNASSNEAKRQAGKGGGVRGNGVMLDANTRQAHATKRLEMPRKKRTRRGSPFRPRKTSEALQQAHLDGEDAK